ncbi:MAG: hypothetical protein GX058_08485 [Firmicutes bacterium]|nr:hypothetical protein [Bacillota bacterium]
MWETGAMLGVLVLSLYLASLSVDGADLSDFQREYGSRRAEHPAIDGKANVLYSYWGPY